jgi:hypothetical protein
VTPEDCVKKGMFLFPLWAKNKPIGSWPKISTTNIETINGWIQQYSGCIFGVDCGKSGMAVVDDDRGKNPLASRTMMALEIDNGPLPSTLLVSTPSSGFHHYLIGLLRSSNSGIGPGVDIKSSGGYVIAPCSPGYNVVHNGGIAECPDWLKGLAGKPRERTEKETTPLIPWDGELAVSLAVKYLKTAPPALMGSAGNETIYITAAHVKDLGVSKETTIDLMLEHWYPRCEPNNRHESMVRIAGNAYTYGELPPGISNPEAVFEEWIDPDPNFGAFKAPGELRYKLLRSADVDLFPPLEWRVHGLIPARGLIQIFGPSKSGKSFLTFDLLAAIAEGLPWFGYTTFPCDVIYVCLEGEAGMQQRKQAWEMEKGRKLPDNFYMVPQFVGINIKQDIIDLSAAAPRGCIIAVDTQNRSAPTAKESASEDMGLILQGAKMLQDRILGLVALVAHTGKDLSRGVRGHSSQEAAMDAVLEVRRDGDLRWWRADKVKDGRDGDIRKFKLKTLHLRDDQYGKPVTSCVIDTDVTDLGDGAGGVELTAIEEDVWVVAKMLSLESVSGEFSRKVWQAKMREQWSNIPSGTRDNRFSASVKKLVNSGLILTNKGKFTIGVLTDVAIED